MNNIFNPKIVELITSNNYENLVLVYTLLEEKDQLLWLLDTVLYRNCGGEIGTILDLFTVDRPGYIMFEMFRTYNSVRKLFGIEHIADWEGSRTDDDGYN